MAVTIAVAVNSDVGVNRDGRREVLGMAIGSSEAEAFWLEFLRSLKRPRPGQRQAGHLRRP